MTQCVHDNCDGFTLTRCPTGERMFPPPHPHLTMSRGNTKTVEPTPRQSQRPRQRPVDLDAEDAAEIARELADDDDEDEPSPLAEATGVRFHREKRPKGLPRAVTFEDTIDDSQRRAHVAGITVR